MTRTLHITKCEARPYVFTAPPTSEAYALLILVNAADVTSEEQATISQAIVASGARYVAAWGYKCSSWDDSVDLAYLETDPNFQPPDDTFITTTWHENESAEEAFEFLWMCGLIDDVYPKTVCAFFIGKNAEAEAEIMKLAKNFKTKENENLALQGDAANSGRCHASC
jgi:hypothetical protein